MSGAGVRPTILVAAFSARQMAESARRAGLDALAVDFFGDLDLHDTARAARTLRGHYPDGFSADELMAALDELAGSATILGFAHGAGFEDRPELLDRIAARWPILGADAAMLRVLKDPERFAALCAAAGVDHPAIRRDAPPDSAGWLSKAVGGAGGSHVRHVADAPPEPGRYHQRLVPGPRWSAAFLGTPAGETRILGFTRQWCDPSPEEPFRYGGAVGPLVSPEPAGALMRAAIARFARTLPLVGLGSADFVLAEDGPVLLEINQRFGATVDVFDTEAAPLMALHLAACRGELPAFWTPPGAIRACGLAWAAEPVSLPPGFRWPDWTSDRSRPPAAFPAGAPLCTVRAEGDTADAAEALFRDRTRSILHSASRRAA
ncbi:ATP-grasp domain-containing protein [Antarcticirhabdus aurantiaca]|uniref:ATP-grasp domain-containing protein n=1 Tax=Antarcticirhabdus aurantiaca TaxID=2606717 RepID=A0ACD4NJ44_9HYPH|nr:ATP-grasp domain-containing protein [Antarcticirhabdus aurantiaca]WAJ26786.1 ATP-grasp domain-containing protein [Jeongeuplla avenae]